MHTQLFMHKEVHVHAFTNGVHCHTHTKKPRETHWYPSLLSFSTPPQGEEHNQQKQNEESALWGGGCLQEVPLGSEDSAGLKGFNGVELRAISWPGRMVLQWGRVGPSQPAVSIQQSYTSQQWHRNVMWTLKEMVIAYRQILVFYAFIQTQQRTVVLFYLFIYFTYKSRYSKHWISTGKSPRPIRLHKSLFQITAGRLKKKNGHGPPPLLWPTKRSNNVLLIGTHVIRATSSVVSFWVTSLPRGCSGRAAQHASS